MVLQVFDAIGRQVHSLKSATLTAGQYEVIWDGKNSAGAALGTGMYFLYLRYRTENTDNWSQLVRQVTILR